MQINNNNNNNNNKKQKKTRRIVTFILIVYQSMQRESDFTSQSVEWDSYLLGTFDVKFTNLIGSNTLNET